MSILNRQRSIAGRHYATALKAGGAGAAATGTRSSVAGDIDWGGILGPIVEGAASGIGERVRRAAAGNGGGGGGGGGSMSRALAGLTGPCPPGYTRIGTMCIDPSAAAPGGAPLTVTAGGNAVMGAFGMPAMQPMVEERVVRSCGPGMVLGKDNLCYPKGILSRRSKWRKWRQPPRPPITSSDVQAIRKAARAKDRVLDLAKDVGLHASKSKPRRR